MIYKEPKEGIPVVLSTEKIVSVETYFLAGLFNGAVGGILLMIVIRILVKHYLN